MLNSDYDDYDDFDDYEITPEEEEEMIARHVQKCKEKEVEYCKICAEY